jgi:radical SAM superfamily enzyme YgiQ (UPF0313 family)|tara:strand:+ start:252 stop:1718 length:1467 start_codon:yes stop_codon:yes gene_type:complete
MRVSLIYIQTVEGNNVNPPLGLMYVAAAAERAGHVVQFMDVDPTVIDVIERVRTFAPDLVGLSFLTTEFDKAQHLSYELKKTFPSLILCCGGVHTTLDTENVLRTFDVDFCIVGEGENTFLEVCDNFEKRLPYDHVKGVWLLKEGLMVKNPLRELIDDLDSLPFPARHLIDYSNIYLTFPGCIKGKYTPSSTAIMAGRGCAFNCNYCAAQKLLGRNYRLRSPDNVVKEIIHLQRVYDIKGILFQDSTLTTKKKWIMSLCEEIIRRNVKFVWSCNTRVNTVDAEMVRQMKKAGCIQMEYGIESGSPKILKILNKRISHEQAINAFRTTESAGIRTGASFMLGNPDEEISDIQMTFDLAKKLNASYTIFFFTIPYPGTELWEIARKREMIPENVSFGTDWNIRAAENPIMNTNISADQLRYYRSKFQNYFFLRNYLRINNLIVGLNLLGIMIRNPIAVWNGCKRVVRYKRWDSLVEEILVAYRKSLSRYY